MSDFKKGLEALESGAAESPRETPKVPPPPEGLPPHPTVEALRARFGDAIGRHELVAGDEHIIYVDSPHLSIAAFDGMADRTITISGHSKTFSATGWRLGYCIAPEEISNGIRRVHDFLTVGAPHPLQLAGAAALRMPTSYYVSLLEGYRRRREAFMPYLKNAGFVCESPAGAYYVMCDFSPFGFDDDRKFLEHLLTEIGVAGVPGSSFLHPPEAGRKLIRFMFAKKEETLHEAGKRLLKLRG